MSAKEMLISEIEHLPEPVIEDALLFIRFAARQRENPPWLDIPKSNADPLQIHPELAGRILYDPTEPATEADWPADAR